MPRRIIDISIYLENDVASDPEGYDLKISYYNHQNTFSRMQPFFPGLKKEDLPDGEAWQLKAWNSRPTMELIWTRLIISIRQ